MAKLVGGGRNKACLILHCLDPPPLSQPSMSRVKYNIFIVDDLHADIVDDGFARVSPTFQIDCGLSPTEAAFCVLGGTLYMFEGCNNGAGGKSVFALDLALTQTLTQEMRKLEKGGALLRKIGEVSSPKAFHHVALPTPDGEKILVFSTEKLPESVFELFEPASGSCEQLPPIPGFWNFIDLYGFVDSSHMLLVQTQPTAVYVIDLAGNKRWVEADASAFYGGLYALDLSTSADDRHWVRLGTIYSGVERLPPGCCASFETVEDSRFCIVNSCGFYDLEEYVGDYGHDDVRTYSVFGPPERGGCGCYAALLSYGDENKGECDFCHMVMGSPSSSSDGRATQQQTCRATIDVCRVDLESYKEMADQLSLEGLRWSRELKHSKTRILKTLRFSMGFEGTRKLCGRNLFFTL